MKNVLQNFCIFLLFLIYFFCSSVNSVFGMSSTNYIINWDNVNTGGTEESSSSNYKVYDTLGGVSAGGGASANYGLRSGYRLSGEEGELPMITFSLETQQNSSKTVYTIFDNSGTKVTVSSTSGYSIDDYIIVVENEGGSELVSIGKISGISGSDLSVDKWSGDNGTMSSSPSGGDDFVYKLNGSIGDLGFFTPSSINTSSSFIEVTTNSIYGYEASISEDGNLRMGAYDIDDVTDGEVTAGSEEYGISTRGDDAYGTGDFAITSSTKIAEKTSIADNQRTAVIYQVAVSPMTVTGNYSQVLTYTVTGNF